MLNSVKLAKLGWQNWATGEINAFEYYLQNSVGIANWMALNDTSNAIAVHNPNFTWWGAIVE